MSVTSSVSSVEVGIAYSVLTSSGSNSITINCGSSGVIGIDYEEIAGLGTSFDTLTGTGSCSSSCSSALTTSAVTIPTGTNYFAVGVAYATPGYNTGTPGSGFSLNEPLFNPMQAAEYSASLGSTTNFPITDQTTPTYWVDAGVAFVENEAFSYQLNLVFPSCSGCPKSTNFVNQEVIEYDLVTGNCYAVPYQATKTTFSCSQADQSGDTFEWTNSFSSNYFSSISFYLNGVLQSTWTSSQILGCSSCASLTDAYAQSVFVGWGGFQIGGVIVQSGSYANFYDGQGTMTYSGLSPLSCTPSCGSTVATGETSNNQFSTPTYSGGVYDQSFYSGTVAQTLLGYSTCSGSHLYNPSDIIGVPDGQSAEYDALNSGGCAQTSTDFGGTPSSYSGNLAIYGYSSGVSSSVDVYCGSSLVYSGSWGSSTSDQPAWIDIGSVSSCKGVTIDSLYQANIYVDALSLYT